MVSPRATLPSRLSVLRAVERRVANPLFETLLRSRLHWPASRWLMLVSYVGPRSGRRYTFPVAYARFNDATIVLTSKRESAWWRNFQQPRECYVWFEGEVYPATGRVLTGHERGRLLGEYLERRPFLSRLLGIDTTHRAAPDQLSRANPEIAVVRFTVDERAWEPIRVAPTLRPDSTSVPLF
ncbi:hypothetical protein [Natronomonas sp. EA1]|uniref:hypothetical protein n=1 Tax=Natronomonas sp. EA1 TaxID=3421655 RepID=UPI003EB6D41F